MKIINITDFYDFENWEIKEKEGTIDWIIKTLNNNAEKQQKAGELVPYVYTNKIYARGVGGAN